MLGRQGGPQEQRVTLSSSSPTSHHYWTMEWESLKREGQGAAEEHTGTHHHHHPAHTLKGRQG